MADYDSLELEKTGYGAEPPKDIEAEKAVLGSMIISEDAVSDVIDKLVFEDFYLKEHQEIYRAIVEMYRRSINIDELTLKTQLDKNKTLEMIGGLAYLTSLSDFAIVPSNATHYADAIIAKSHMRRLIKEAEIIRSSAYDGKRTPEEILDTAEQRIYEIAHRTQNRDYVDINDIFVENIKDIQELERNKGELPGITTGFKDLDAMLGGLHKTDLIVLAARPGMGKTAFALNVAQNAAFAGNSVIIFSLEMGNKQLGQRMLAMAATVDMQNIRRGTLTMEDWQSLSEAQDEFEGKKIVIDEGVNLSILEMKNKCRRLKAERGLDLVIIDYLQLMSMGGAENREKEISALTRGIKLMAKELDCAVILLSQLSRNSENRKDHKPQLSDLRESGAIEQDADIVIFLRREDYYADDDEEADAIQTGGVCEVNVAKHRNGPTGIVDLAWVARYTKFANLERHANYN